MTNEIHVKCKESFKRGIQYAFVLADMLNEEFKDMGLWSNIDGNDVLSDEFKDEIARKINKYFDRMIREEEENNWPDYVFEEQEND